MRIVTVLHFGNSNPYTFLTDISVKAGEVLVADTKKGSQLVYALTSDYDIKDNDAHMLFSPHVPYRKIICKVDNTCYCNGTRASEIPMSPISLEPITYFCGRRWVGVEEDLPKDNVIVVVRLDNDKLRLAIRKNQKWIDAYTSLEVFSEVKAWLNIDLEKRGVMNE